MEPTIQELLERARAFWPKHNQFPPLIQAVSLLVQKVEALEKELAERKQFDHMHVLSSPAGARDTSQNTSCPTCGRLMDVSPAMEPIPEPTT